MLRFFHRLRVSQKLALISILFMIPDTVLLCLFLFSINANIKFAELERMGNEYQAPLEELLELLPVHAMTSTRAGVEGRIDAALDRLREVDDRIGANLQFTEEGLAKRKRQHCTVHNLSSEWAALKRAGGEDYHAHLHLVSDVRTMITHAGDSSNLILDPDLDSYYLMDVTLLALPEMQDRLWTAAFYGQEVLQGGSLSNAQRNQLAINAAMLAMADLDRVSVSAETALNEDPNFYGASETLGPHLRPALAVFRDRAARFIELTRQLSEDEAGSVTPAMYFEAGASAHAESFKLWKAAKQELDVLLEKRVEYYRGRRARSLILTACALLAAVGFVTFITRSISGPLQQQAARLRSANCALQEEIKERHRAEAALKEAEQKYRGIFENSVEGIFQTTREGKYLVANPTLARIYGYASPSELQVSMTDIGAGLYVDPNRRAEFQRQIGEKGEIFGFESEVVHKSGARIWISENARAVYGENREFLYYEGTVEDITARKQNEAALEKARKEVLAATRLAGMAEVATGILHNVGNVLNSVNVSTICISDSVRKSRVVNLPKVAAMLKENSSRLPEFLVADEKGKKIPGYLMDLAQHLSAEHTALLQKLDELKTHLDHVKEIVAMQQGYAKVGGVTENVRISELVEDAVRLNENGLARHPIEIVREFDAAANALVDKHKVLQILVNLVRNAEHACAQSTKREKKITLRVEHHDEQVRVSVEDNGTGIAPENMVRIFKHGFTTKKDGHGFGLHSCALAAQELGGVLRARSDGPDRGAIFTLELPVAASKARYPIVAC